MAKLALTTRADQRNIHLMTIPRKNHYLPKSFLSAWTDTGTLEGQLQVIDKSTARSWTTRPTNAAVEKDLYIIDLSEVEDDVAASEIEDTFCTVESAALPVIRSVIEGADVSAREDRENLMAFLALLTLRVPARLRWVDNLLRTPVEACLSQLDAEGRLPYPDDPTLARQLKEWVSGGAIQVQIKQNARLGMMVSALPALMKLLMRRRWTALRTQPCVGDLICSDNPVILNWIKHVPAGASPGFGLKNTRELAPLGPSTALIGLWDAEPKDTSLDEDQVAFWNGELLGSVERFVFTRGDFAALHGSGVIDRRADVIRRWGIPGVD